MNNILVKSPFREAWEIQDRYNYDEKKNTTYGIYVGHLEIPHEKGTTQILPKMGSCTHITKVAEEYSKGGADWFFDFFYPCDTLEEAKELEGILKMGLLTFVKIGNQGQILYNMEYNHCVEEVQKLILAWEERNK